MDKLASYFNLVSDTIKCHGELAGIGKHPGDIGTRREIICRDLLQKHLPRRLTVGLGGEIFGTSGPRSSQIDIVVANDISIAFEMFERAHFPVESVVAAVSVKSRLTDAELKDGLSNLASIPSMDRSVLNLNLKPHGVQQFLDHYPVKILFAYDSDLSIQTCIKRIVKFYSSQTTYIEHCAHAVIVNGKFIVTRTQQSSSLEYSGSFFKTAEHQALRGLPLFWMLCEISKGVSWLDHMMLNFQPYYDATWAQAKARAAAQSTGKGRKSIRKSPVRGTKARKKETGA